MTKLDLTVVIPTKDDAIRLASCLQAVGDDFATEIVVVDSQSSDETQQLCERHGVKLIQFHWDGSFPKKRNWLLRNHRPSTSWVLFLDSDEILTHTFKSELAGELPNSNLNGYWLNYTVYFLGKRLRGGYPLKKLALFRVGAGEYERIDESRWSKLDMEIHEHPVIEGEVGEISAKIDHRDFRDVFHYVAKHNEYSSWEAHRFLQMRDSDDDRSLTLKQRIKYRLVESPLGGVAFFCGAYFLMGGFLDGARGLAFAILKMSYFTQVYCKIREIRGQQLPRPQASREISELDRRSSNAAAASQT